MPRHNDNTDAAAQEADDYVSEHGTGPDLKVEIFGTNTCKYCQKAKELCDKYGLTYSYYNIDEDFASFDHLVSRIGKWNTVPQIFMGAKHVGGYDDLLKKLEFKELP